jgi:hypothetical protein
VRAVALAAKGTFVRSASESRCAVTSENVTRTAFASANGVSVIINVNDPPPDGDVGESLPLPHAHEPSDAAVINAIIQRIRYALQSRRGARTLPVHSPAITPAIAAIYGW